MNRELKVGDKFVVVKQRTSKMNHNGEMDGYLGKIMTADKIYEDTFRCSEDGGRWLWSDRMVDWEATESLKNPRINNQIEKVLVNGKATIVFFTDKTKSVVVHDDDLPYDKEKAVAVAITKKFLGGYTPFKEVLEKVEVKTKIIKYDDLYMVKVGDIFTVVDEFDPSVDYESGVASSMEKMCGKKVIIEGVLTKNEFRIKNFGYIWNRDMFKEFQQQKS